MANVKKPGGRKGVTPSKADQPKVKSHGFDGHGLRETSGGSLRFQDRLY
jgi:hypothetical protein